MNKKLSVIVVVRNDNYGQHLYERLSAFFKSVSDCKHDLELVLVEWNPPVDKESFYNYYKTILPKNKKIKIITIPSDIHNSFLNSNYFKVFEYIAKNTGARYAAGEYLLFTNPDNIYIEELWDELFNNLEPNYFIRAGRIDLNYKNIDFSDLTCKEIINNLDIKVIHKYTGSGVFHNASGDFLCINKNVFFNNMGYDERTTYSHMDSIILDKLIGMGLSQKVLKNYTFHIDHERPNGSAAYLYNLETDMSTFFRNTSDWGLKDKKIFINEYN